MSNGARASLLTVALASAIVCLAFTLAPRTLAQQQGGQAPAGRGARSGPVGVEPWSRQRGPIAPPPPIRLPEGVQEISNGFYRITSGRALGVAADLLERKLGVPISYEDPAWLAPKDLVLSTARHLLVPREIVDIRLPATLREARELSPADVIQQLIDNFHAAGNPGEFKLVQFGTGEYAIVATRARDQAGQWVAQTSPLDLRVSFPEQERSQSEMLDTIVRAINAIGDTKLGRNLGPKPNSPQVRLGARNELARDLVSKVLRTGTKLSWRLYCDPHGQGSCSLNLHGVRVESEEPNGVWLRNIFWPK